MSAITTEKHILKYDGILLLEADQVAVWIQSITRETAQKVESFKVFTDWRGRPKRIEIETRRL